jgi:hypothetical protein
MRRVAQKSQKSREAGTCEEIRTRQVVVAASNTPLCSLRWLQAVCSGQFRFGPGLT